MASHMKDRKVRAARARHSIYQCLIGGETAAQCTFLLTLVVLQQTGGFLTPEEPKRACVSRALLDHFLERFVKNPPVNEGERNNLWCHKNMWFYSQRELRCYWLIDVLLMSEVARNEKIRRVKLPRIQFAKVRTLFSLLCPVVCAQVLCSGGAHVLCSPTENPDLPQSHREEKKGPDQPLPQRAGPNRPHGARQAGTACWRSSEPLMFCFLCATLKF